MYSEQQIELNKIKYIDQRKARSVYYLLTTDISGEPEDRWIYSRDFYYTLDKLGIDFQDWFDQRILGIFNHDDRPICKNHGCNNHTRFVRNRRFYRDFCSWECQLDYNQHDDECNQRKSESIAEAYERDPSLREMRSIRRTELNYEMWSDPNSAFNSEEWRAKKSILASEIFSRPWSESHKENMRLSMLNRMQERPDTVHSLGLHGWYKTVFCFNKDYVFYRSSYELKYLELLDFSTEIAGYEWEPFPIPYEYGYYLPDVLVYYFDGRKEIHEVKAKWRLTAEDVILKSNAAKTYCNKLGYTYKFITEDDLF